MISEGFSSKKQYNDKTWKEYFPVNFRDEIVNTAVDTKLNSNSH